jgi:hypothetical protein
MSATSAAPGADGVYRDPIAFTQEACRVAAAPFAFTDAFLDDGDGLEALTRGARTGAVNAGVVRAASVAERVAFMQSQWLMSSLHPHGTALGLRIEYAPARRELTVRVSDAGRRLPERFPGSEWREGIRSIMHAQALYTVSGREVWVVLKVREAWRVRLAWDLGKLKCTHPQFTFAGGPTEAGAHATARAALSPVGSLLGVCIQGPDDGDEEWWPVRTDEGVEQIVRDR